MNLGYFTSGIHKYFGTLKKLKGWIVGFGLISGDSTQTNYFFYLDHSEI